MTSGGKNYEQSRLKRLMLFCEISTQCGLWWTEWQTDMHGITL